MFKKYKYSYLVNEYGVIKNENTNKIYKGIKDSSGYLRIDVSHEGKRFIIFPHRAVTEIFIPNLENKPYVNHINGIKTDNRLENLEWVTAKENSIHASENKLLNIVNKRKIKVTNLNDNTILVYESVLDFLKEGKISNSSFYRNIGKEYKNLKCEYV